LAFPEITVCNANAFQQSLMEKYNISWPKNEGKVDLISQSFESFMLETQFNNFSYFEHLMAEAIQAKNTA